MPVIKSAKKRMRQNIKRRARNFPVRSEMKSSFKKMLKLIKDGQSEEATKFMPYTYSIIDKACKKNIIHLNNASRKKSRIAREYNVMMEKGGKKPESAPVEEKVEEKVAEKSEEKAETKA